jgi:hypothetical protein
MRPILLLLVLLLAPAPSAGAETLRFVAFGDMPYCRDTSPAACQRQLDRVDRLIERINAETPAFSIFLGDTKGGNESCEDARILRTLDWFGRHRAALVYTPGDNEWVDCLPQTTGPGGPLDRLRLIRERFFAGPRSLGQAPIALQRQAEAMPGFADYVENARWSAAGLRFLTLHVTGSNNNLPDARLRPDYDAAAEHRARNAANLAWLADTLALAEREGAAALVIGMQADMFYPDRCGRGSVGGLVDTRRAVVEAARRFARPVLLLFGDSHYFEVTRPDPAAPNLQAVMVPGNQDVRAVLVRYESGAAEPFGFSLLGEADQPARNGC